MSNFCRVPPSPEVMSLIYMDYLRYGKPHGLSFKRYLKVIGFVDPAHSHLGMDDGVSYRSDHAGLRRIDIPEQPVTGDLRVKVLLIDFPDKVGVTPAEHYEDMLFSEGVYPTGSMADYYREVSHGKVNIDGSVHGWLRMPREYSFYTNNESGTGWHSYPRNAPRMAEDAVRTALEVGIEFEPELDMLNQGVITALFIIHAGRGAETLHPAIQGSEIWSHKWELRRPLEVAQNLYAMLYLTVPQDCKIGVCAHELGHLAFQWQDFYDPNYDEDGEEWDGTGDWDLMAGGSYNGDSLRPAHPAALHKSQHGWIEVETITNSCSVTLHPHTDDPGRVIKLVSPFYEDKQYLLLENRVRRGFDFHLPGEGLLVWRVDERARQVSPKSPGLMLIQADGRHNLESPDDWNQGDAGDPFPGSTNRTELNDTGAISTSFDGQPRSGIHLKNISRDVDSGRISFDIDFSGEASVA